LVEVINKSCGLDIHKRFLIATILSKSGEKQQQRFDRNDNGILALKNRLRQNNVTLLLVNQPVTFWFLFTIR
jgi:transposase